jgi:transposase
VARRSRGRRTTVARTAKVSTWLVYAEGVREHIEAAIRQQEHEPVVARSDGRQASPASLKSDLMMAREEIIVLRQERDRLRKAVRQQLGQQLDPVGDRQLTERIAELTEANRRLERSEAHMRAEAQRLTSRIASLEKDLAATRTSLRRMIRDENRC